ncbi:MAG: hypothetical protein C5B59_05775 [Bacteroidetes bacterium]|nr:MAG: hypothetical protein C5B59_05775 [Bacteroidota bacterium]
MSRLRQILLSLLGEKKYLALLASTFQRLLVAKRLGPFYQDIYFLKEMIAPGDYCADIGAHLGYYTIEMSRLVKDQGRVYAVEPMSKFYLTLQRLLRQRNCRNVELNQVAMGGDKEFVEMGIPNLGGMKKFGHARVQFEGSGLSYIDKEKVRNVSGDTFFEKIPRLDFIKCDVEGLEIPVFASMLKTIELHHPTILCELGDKGDRIKLYEMLQPFGYEVFYLENKKLHKLDVHSDFRPVSHNHYFVSSRRL